MPETNETNDSMTNDSLTPQQENESLENASSAEVENDAENEPQPPAVESDEQLRARIRAARAEAKISAKKETYDRGTVTAFGLLFVLPAVIIVLSLLFLFPFVMTMLQEEPSGATTTRAGYQR